MGKKCQKFPGVDEKKSYNIHKIELVIHLHIFILKF